MKQWLTISLLALVCIFTAQGRTSLTRPYVDALQREWSVMDSPRKQHRSARSEEISENVRDRFVDAYMMERQGRRQLAAGAYMEILDSLRPTPELYIHANMALVDFYRNKPAYENAYAEYLLQAAQAMAKARQINPDTYVELGNYLISKGFRPQGEEALKIAATRLAQTGRHQSADELTRLASVESSRRQQTIWLLVTLSLAVAVCSAIYAIYTARKNASAMLAFKKQEAEMKADTEHNREVNSNFISLALRGVEELNDFNTFVTRKLAAGQAKALYAETESGTYLQTVSDRFFEDFDNLFLASFPNFIHAINGLLKKDRQFPASEDGHLSPELRIAAFMMIGISDTAKLAQVMNLSVNTIYTYRNRLRSRATDRDAFERQLQMLKDRQN